MTVWLLWVLLLAAGFSSMNRLAEIYPTVSLRYDTPIPYSTAANAREYATGNAEQTGFWPTFWAEQQGVTAEGLHTASVRCLWFSGDANLVWPADFIQGSYPGPLDDAGCSISNTLAWQLWGTEDAVGYELTIENQKYTVHGVFREEDLLAMASVGDSAFADGWQAVELAGTPNGEARAAALDFAGASGLGTPATVVDGPAITAVACFLARAPLAVMCAALLVALLRFMAKVLPGRGYTALLGLALAIAAVLALPALLESLPPSFIPTRFSDFAFWGRLFSTTWEHVQEWLLLRPHHIDLQAKLLLGTQAGIFILQSAISIALLKIHLFEVNHGKNLSSRLSQE